MNGTNDNARQVGDLATEIARLAGEEGVADFAEMVREQSAAAGEAANVVVIGEKKRGKSSLINALLGRPGLLPVDVDVATSVHVRIAFAERPYALVVDKQTMTSREVPLVDLAQYAAVDPATGEPVRTDVAHVEIGLPDLLLRDGLAFVDTPGVGGLVAGHTMITLAALSRADALVFVVNGSSELTASELRFLENASARVATVLFVMTQIDKYGSWRQVLQKNLDLLASHAPGQARAPWFAVSSRARLDADRLAADGQTEAAARRLESSGFPPLTAALRERVASRAGRLRQANVLRACGLALARLDGALERQERSLAQDPGLASEVERRRGRLAELEDGHAAWRRRLDDGEAAARQALLNRYGELVADLSQMVTGKIASGDRTLQLQLPVDLDAAMRGIWMDLENTAKRRLADLAERLRQDLDLPGLDAVAMELAYPARLVAPTGPTAATRQADGRGLTLPGATVALVDTAGFVGLVLGMPPVLLVAARTGLIVFLERGQRRQEELRQTRADAERFARHVFHEMDAAIPAALEKAVREARRQLERRIADRLAERREQLRLELTEHERHQRTAKAELDQEREVVTNRRRALAGLRTRAEVLALALGVEDGPPGLPAVSSA